MIAVQTACSIARQQRWTAAAFAGVALAFAVLLAFDVEAASCRGYPKAVRAAIKKQVEVLRALEREASDRLKGLDTRPFEYLLDRARAAAGVIGDKDALASEEGLSRCPEPIPPVRRVCMEAAHALVGLIEQLTVGSATPQAKQVEARAAEAKQAYSRAMPQCERWMDVAPLVTVFRTGE
jgi:uncharacterized protein (UPF0212 family)